MTGPTSCSVSLPAAASFSYYHLFALPLALVCSDRSFYGLYSLCTILSGYHASVTHWNPALPESRRYEEELEGLTAQLHVEPTARFNNLHSDIRPSETE